LDVDPCRSNFKPFLSGIPDPHRLLQHRMVFRESIVAVADNGA
jgi:hypothetical protein